MKRCFACQCCFESRTWDCPHCGHRPTARNGVLCFNEDPPVAGNGFKPEYFAKLARFEEITSGFARGTGSSNGRWVITFRMSEVS